MEKPSASRATWLVARLLHTAHGLARPLTLGVRAVVIDRDDRVLLVRHGYTPGWHLPGGGVEAGETARQALDRELDEEAGVALDEEPLLHGVFFNTFATKRDHVLVYVARAFRRKAAPAPTFEIRETGFFPRDALPGGATRATRDRIAELFAGAPKSDRW